LPSANARTFNALPGETLVFSNSVLSQVSQRRPLSLQVVTGSRGAVWAEQLNCLTLDNFGQIIRLFLQGYDKIFVKWKL